MSDVETHKVLDEKQEIRLLFVWDKYFKYIKYVISRKI